MKIFPVTPAALARLAGKTPADDLRDQLAFNVLRRARAQRQLTSPKSFLYGKTFWMVTAAEVEVEAEQNIADLRARLDAMGEPHGKARQDALLRQEGFLPPMTPGEAALAAQAALLGRTG